MVKAPNITDKPIKLSTSAEHDFPVAVTIFLFKSESKRFIVFTPVRDVVYISNDTFVISNVMIQTMYTTIIILIKCYVAMR